MPAAPNHLSETAGDRAQQSIGSARIYVLPNLNTHWYVLRCVAATHWASDTGLLHAVGETWRPAVSLCRARGNRHAHGRQREDLQPRLCAGVSWAELIDGSVIAKTLRAYLLHRRRLDTCATSAATSARARATVSQSRGFSVIS